MNVRSRVPGSAAQAVRRQEVKSARSRPERSCASLTHPVPGGVPGSGRASRPFRSSPRYRMRLPTHIPPIRSLPAIAGPPSRSAAGIAVRASAASASDAVRPSATMFRMSAINPTKADRMARSASIDCPAARALLGLGQLALGRRGARAVFAARPHRPICGDVPRRRRSGTPLRTTRPPSIQPARRRSRADPSVPLDP